MFHLGSDTKQKVMVCAACYFLQSEQSPAQETSLEMRGDTCRKGRNVSTNTSEKLPLIHTAGKNRDL